MVSIFCLIRNHCKYTENFMDPVMFILFCRNQELCFTLIRKEKTFVIHTEFSNFVLMRMLLLCQVMTTLTVILIICKSDPL